MSYIRWSSMLPITEPCSTCNREPWDESKGPWIERLEEWLEYDRSTGFITPDDGLCPECRSRWYIFPHVDGCLAVWHVSAAELPCYTREDVQGFVEDGYWEIIPGWDGDPYNIVRDAMRDYLADTA